MHNLLLLQFKGLRAETNLRPCHGCRLRLTHCVRPVRQSLYVTVLTKSLEQKCQCASRMLVRRSSAAGARGTRSANALKPKFDKPKGEHISILQDPNIHSPRTEYLPLTRSATPAAATAQPSPQRSSGKDPRSKCSGPRRSYLCSSVVGRNLYRKYL